jgi:hypothetical protein
MLPPLARSCGEPIRPQRAAVADLIDELAAIRKRYCGLVDLDVEFCVLETRRLRRPSKEGAEEEGE